MATTVVDTFLTAGPARTGHWCDTCAKPSTIVIPLFGLTSKGVVRLCDYRRCIACRPLGPRRLRTTH
jgi:hypothetical protein